MSYTYSGTNTIYTEHTESRKRECTVEVDVRDERIPDCQITSAKLYLFANNGGGKSVSVDGKSYYLLNTRIVLDISDKMQNGHCKLTFSSISSVTFNTSNAQIELEYVSSGSIHPSIRIKNTGTSRAERNTAIGDERRNGICLCL